MKIKIVLDVLDLGEHATDVVKETKKWIKEKLDESQYIDFEAEIIEVKKLM